MLLLVGFGVCVVVCGIVGFIMIGLLMEEKDKGFNKGDIFNGFVVWMWDFMWLVEFKIYQVEEFLNFFMVVGIKLFFEIIEDEQCMQLEVLDMMFKDFGIKFIYLCIDGFNFCVLDFIDYVGKKLSFGNNGILGGYMLVSFSNGMGGYDMLDVDDFLDYDEDDNDNGVFKLEVEYGRMDML